MSCWLDGRFVAAAELPPAAGVAPFETMGAAGGTVALWERHLERLARAASRLRLSFAAPPDLRAAASALLLQNGDGDGVLRLVLLPAADGRTHLAMTTRPRGVRITRVQLVPTVVAREPGDPPADLKAEPRRFYDRVRQQAQDGGADDGIVVDRDGAVLETALANLWLRLGGTWVTPPLDGRVLPGIARALVLERAAAAGLAVAERGCRLDDLHAAEALAVTNAVHGVRAAVLLGGDAAAAAAGVRSVDSELLPLWRAATVR